MYVFFLQHLVSLSLNELFLFFYTPSAKSVMKRKDYFGFLLIYIVQEIYREGKKSNTVPICYSTDLKLTKKFYVQFACTILNCLLG